MVETIKTVEVRFPGLNINPALLHKVRGFFSDKYREYDLVHNHKEGTGVYYRYPAVQFKALDQLSIFGFGEDVVRIMEDIFLNSDSIRIEDDVINIRESTLHIRDLPFGEDGAFYDYEFRSPWVALNQANFSRYCSMDSPEQRHDMLNSILINNIIAFCKFMGYTVKERLVPENDLIETQSNLKGKSHIAFKGQFRVNFRLPDNIGIGKSSSRGYGTIHQLNGAKKGTDELFLFH